MTSARSRGGRSPRWVRAVAGAAAGVAVGALLAAPAAASGGQRAPAAVAANAGGTAPSVAYVPFVPQGGPPAGSGRAGRALVAPEAGAAQQSAPVATARFSTIGAEWSGPLAGAAISVRTRTGGVWSAWTDLTKTDGGPDGGTADARSARPGGATTEPFYAGDSDAVQTRVTGSAPTGLKLVLVDPGTAPAADAAAGSAPADAASPGAGGGLRSAATVATPAIYSRAQWGADESLRARNPGCGTPSYGSTVKVGFVHHTDGPNDYSAAAVPSIIRGIYAFHVQANGWCDIGYNFLVDKFGRIWEGRAGGISKPVIGAHTGGFNTDSFGAAYIGTYTGVAPTSASVTAMQQLFAWRFAIAYRDPFSTAVLHAAVFDGARYPPGTQVAFAAVSGHSDADFTDCPGARGYATLPAIRSGARALIGAGLVTPSTFSTPSVTKVRSTVLTTQTWQLTITGSGGTVVRTYSGTTNGPIRVDWDHADGSGNPVPPGTYRLTLTSAAGAATAVPWSADVRLPAVPSNLSAGYGLGPGDSIYSAGGQYRLAMQTNGDLVAFGNGRPLWDTHTQGNAGATLNLRPDGELVVASASGRTLWAFGSAGAGDTAHFVLTASGAFEVYSDYGIQRAARLPGTDALLGPVTLAPGQFLTSGHGQYQLEVAGDGTVYVLGNGHILWRSPTSGHPGASLDLQADGTLTVKDPSGAVVWTAAPAGGSGTQVLRIQDDGNLRLTSGTATRWQNGAIGSDTLFGGGRLLAGQYLHSPNGRFRLVMQNDGNLVVYDGGRALWGAHTRGGGGYAVLQADGNLVVYADGRAQFATWTVGLGANRLIMQNDGNAVLYGRTAVWATATRVAP